MLSVESGADSWPSLAIYLAHPVAFRHSTGLWHILLVGWNKTSFLVIKAEAPREHSIQNVEHDSIMPISQLFLKNHNKLCITWLTNQNTSFNTLDDYNQVVLESSHTSTHFLCLSSISTTIVPWVCQTWVDPVTWGMPNFAVYKQLNLSQASYIKDE